MQKQKKEKTLIVHHMMSIHMNYNIPSIRTTLGPAFIAASRAAGVKVEVVMNIPFYAAFSCNAPINPCISGLPAEPFQRLD